MKVLIVDDERLTRRAVEQTIQAFGHECRLANDGDEAWSVFQSWAPDVVISDWYMPGMDGLDLCREVRRSRRETYTYFILLTVAVGKERLDQAMEAGVDDFLSKPLDPDALTTRLLVASRVAGLHQRARLADERISTLEELNRHRESFQNMIGKSSYMQEVYRRIRLAAQSGVTVLVHGESGTGKELAAQAIHSLSDRAERPFITVNCGALPDSILESELFGHVRGAFTGAIKNKAGLFEMANNGTLLLDEIGDVSPLLQVKLLRVLQEQEVRPVGGDRATRVDVRIIAATNRDLKKLVGRGEFREDLYYRIRVFQIDVPPLRDRREDVPLIVDHYLRKFSEEHGKQVDGVDPVAFQVLMNHSWPGNIRELRNAIEHAFVIVSDNRIRADDLPPEVQVRFAADENGACGDAASMSMEIFEALEECSGSRTEAAKRLGISRVALWKRIRRLGIDSQLPPSPGRSRS